MTFAEVLAQVRELLQSKGRVSYRALKLQFDLDDDYLEGLKDELIEAEHVAADEGGKVLVWAGGATPTAARGPESAPRSSPSKTLSVPLPTSQPAEAVHPEAERRQLTVMFCDVVGSTALSERLDPEELREVMQNYQRACVQVITRFDGYVAKYLGDGLLVYFGYPVAHEDDAARAVRAGLEIVEAIRRQMTEDKEQDTRGVGTPRPPSLQVRIGIHTGLVVAGEMGSGEFREQLAIVGETPNIAARLQDKAAPNSVVISPTTLRLVAGMFAYRALGPQTLKGISAPLEVYQVIAESEARNRFEVAVTTGLTPLVGREHEMGLLLERWDKAKEGEGQMVLLSGEPGIGKSRLMQELKEQVAHDDATQIEFRCSPYYQNTALYPILEYLQRLLQFQREDTPATKLAKLVKALSSYRFPQADTVPLLAALLSLPHPEDHPPLILNPQKQKQKTHEVLVAWIMEEAERQVVYCTWEDLHWADPTTLEILQLYLEQLPVVRMLAVLTFRPEFQPPWSSRSHLSQIMLSRLGRQHIETMAENVAGEMVLPAEVMQQIVNKTDGVPLFVEELTKTVMESGLVREANSRYELTGPLPLLAIPATLHDSLMARLDRLAPVKEIAQLGATLGREFSYEVVQAVSSLDEETLQQGLTRLVEAELVYQRGVLPQAQYIFKHALVQEAAYQSLLKSKRHHYHHQIAQVLEERFPETVETQPEILAHHYTEAGLIVQAVPYWQQAGQRALERSANVEAIRHLTRGLELLKTLPATPERLQHELTLQVTLSAPLMATKGWAAPEVEQASARARELCQQVGQSVQLLPVLWGLWNFYIVRAQLQTAHELGGQFMRLARNTQDPDFLLQAHFIVGDTFFWCGEFSRARGYLVQDGARDYPQRRRSHAVMYGLDPGVACLSHAAWTLWLLGYPEQALNCTLQALTLAREFSHPLSVAWALFCAAVLHGYRQEDLATQERAEALIALSTEQGFPHWVLLGTGLRGWAVTRQEQREEELEPMRQSLTTWRAMGAELNRSHCLALLAEAYGTVGQAEEGLSVLAEALAIANSTGERFYEAELYRLKGELSLKSKQVKASPESEVLNLQPLAPSTQAEAEACFQQAIDIAQRQQAKSLELRATVSLARLWQQHGKKKEARQMLAKIYGWFTEGFDTKDLQEAKGLLEELA